MLYTTRIHIHIQIYAEHNQTYWRTSKNKWTHFFIKIYTSHTLFSKEWCFLCVRGELETRTECYILTPSSSDHSSISFAFWLGCSTVGHWGPKPSVCSWFSLCWHPISNCNRNWNWLKPSVVPGYIIVFRPPASYGLTHLPPSPNSTTSTGQDDIPISSTGCTCFAVLPLIYTGASLDRRLGRGSICNNLIKRWYHLDQNWWTRFYLSSRGHQCFWRTAPGFIADIRASAFVRSVLLSV